MKKHYLFLIAGAVFLIHLLAAQSATAGFLDKINAATQKLEQATQKMNQASSQMEANSQRMQTTQTQTQKFEKTKTTNAITGEWGNQVTCAGPNTATCQNGMDNLVNCMNQTKGYYYRLVTANLEEKLNSGQNLSPQDKKELEEDITSVKEAINTNQVTDPDPKNPQRWLLWLTDEDQQQINSTNVKYMNKVRQDCDKRFGGMSQFSGNH